MDHRNCEIFQLMGTDVEYAVLRPHGLWGTARHRLDQTGRAAQAPVVGADTQESINKKPRL